VSKRDLIGFKSTVTQKAPDYLAGTSFVRGWQYIEGNWSSVSPDTILQPGTGYWITFTASGVIYPQ
jgi:hypothetical protein